MLRDAQIDIIAANVNTYCIHRICDSPGSHMCCQPNCEVVRLSYVDTTRLRQVIEYIDALVPAAVVNEDCRPVFGLVMTAASSAAPAAMMTSHCWTTSDPR